MLSLLKYPNVLCGSDEHASMLVGGSLLLVICVFGFLALCTYAAYRVPSWSATENHKYVRCFRFLVFRFRLDSWWFGVPLLMRGPLISLPIVFATDYAGIQTVWVTVILLSFLACQALAWPWKVPGYWYAPRCMMMCDSVWAFTDVQASRQHTQRHAHAHNHILTQNS